MEEKQSTNSLLDDFLEIVKKGEENKQRLASTKTHELIQYLAELYIEQGKVGAYVKMPEVTAGYNLPKDHYKDLIDIYCLECSQFQSPLSDAKVDMIELIGAEFQDEAFEYMSRLAFNTCWEQDHALRLILNYCILLPSKKHYLNNILRKNFSQLSEDLQNRALDLLDDVDYDKRFISSLEKRRGTNKWWKFWQ